MSIAAALVRDFELEREHSRKVLAAVPEDSLGWKPHDKSMSLGQLAGHIAEAPGWLRSMMTDCFDMDEADREGYKPFVPQSGKELLATLERSADAFGELLGAKDDAFMTATWTMRAGGHEVMALPRDAAIRAILLHHVSHHRGQLTVYLRLLGVPVPSTYGPTADNPSGF